MATAKISAIPLERRKDGHEDMTSSLAAAGKTRYPGTGMYFFPKKTTSGRYVTGLDENAPELDRMFPNEKERKEQAKLIKEKRLRLEKATGLDLSPSSSYWNYSLYTPADQAHVRPIKLGEGDTPFNLNDPLQEITFTWLKQCDDIAPSYESYLRGDKGPQVRFYVHDDEVENTRKYQRKKEINDAVVANDKLTPEKRKKIAVLMDIPVGDNTPESTVYNLLDDKLKETEYKSGKYRSISPIRLFQSLLELDNDLLNVKYLVNEAVAYNVYRVKGAGIVYEGASKVADSIDELAGALCSVDNQEERLALEKKVRNAKLLEV